MSEVVRCTRCLIPKTRETAVFGEHGVRNIGQQHEYKQTQVNWEVKKKELDELIAAR